MNQYFTLQMQSETDGSISWQLEKARVAYGQIAPVETPVRLQAIGIETFILPPDVPARLYFDSLLTARNVDIDFRDMILLGLEA